MRNFSQSRKWRRIHERVEPFEVLDGYMMVPVSVVAEGTLFRSEFVEWVGDRRIRSKWVDVHHYRRAVFLGLWFAKDVDAVEFKLRFA